MARLSVVAAMLLAAAQPANAGNLERWEPYIGEASARFGVPPEWIRRVIEAESNGYISLNGVPITSRAGAMGLMQLMPGTWGDMRLQLGLGPDPFDPHDNIIAGTAYLRAMYDRFGYPGLYAAYNAGPRRYAAHLATGGRLPSETLAYMVKLTSGTAGPAMRGRLPGQVGQPGILVVLANSSERVAADVRKMPDRLFVIRR